jgi:hypothetical protein
MNERKEYLNGKGTSMKKIIWLFILYIACTIGMVFFLVQVISEIESTGLKPIVEKIWYGSKGQS